MKASTMPVARMPKPLVLPPNRKPINGMDPSSFCTGTWKWSANNGANTNRPNMP